MVTEALADFLNEARDKCSYEAVGEEGETELPDGTRVIGPYTNGTFTYKDTYKGFTHFVGREEVKNASGKLIWYRDYDGIITGEGIAGTREKEFEVYDFLKKALRECPEDRPFRRGPEEFKENGYEFFDMCTGDMSSFGGHESITLNGKDVYHLDYAGGYVD